MSLLLSLERRFGRWAIPNLLRFVAIVQLVMFLFVTSQPDGIDLFRLRPDLVWQGEVWRVLSFVFIPQSASLFWLIVAVWFLFFMNDIMERAWGAFRLNLYYFSCVFLLNLASFLLLRGGTGAESSLLYQSLFLALCVVAPEVEIRLFFVLPVKLKYLGFITGLLLAWTLLSVPDLWPQILAVMIPFGLFAGPDWIKSLQHRNRVSARRRKFQGQLHDPEESFHRCAQCGLTEVQDPHAEFRVTADGRELCLPCLEKGANS